MDGGPHTSVVADLDTISTRAVVFFGDKFVEVNDATVTFGDVCASFEISDIDDFFLRERSTKRIVATLPFEKIPLPKTPTAIDEEPTTLIIDLCRRDDADIRSGVHEFSESNMSGALYGLVKLGAAPLLSKDTPHHIEQSEKYTPEVSPTLLVNSSMPASVYSPYRIQRDPLLRSTSTSHQYCMSSGHHVASEPSYSAPIDAYSMETRAIGS